MKINENKDHIKQKQKEIKRRKRRKSKVTWLLLMRDVGQVVMLMLMLLFSVVLEVFSTFFSVTFVSVLLMLISVLC